MTGSDQVLTVAQMRAAEQALIDGGESVESLMERAGAGAADWVWRMAAGRAVTVLCGPGNNGGDGYVIARELVRRGTAVAVVAPVEPGTGAAAAARRSWGGTVAERGAGGVLVDCLFGSGLTRPLSPELAALLGEEARRHSLRIAVDMPSGIESDSGAPLNEGLPECDLTLALGAWKFAHWLMPGMTAMGERRLVPIGVGEIAHAATVLRRPRLSAPAADAHKYTRGLVLVAGGKMPGAALLACAGALRSGAGGVRLDAPTLPATIPPDVILRGEGLDELLADERTGAVVVGPGLGRDDAARERLTRVLRSGRAAVVDADALVLLGPDDLAERIAPLVLTPHEGEMASLAASFGIGEGGKVARARVLAKAVRATVIAKGPDTVIAAPDGRAVLAPSATSWLSVGGTGDVLAGIVAGRVAAGREPFAAACEAVWLHGEAARLAGAAFTASDLALCIPEAYATAL